MSSDGLAYSEPLITPERPPAYGDGHLAYEPPVEIEDELDEGRTHWTLAFATFTPVAAGLWRHRLRPVSGGRRDLLSAPAWARVARALRARVVG